MYDVIIIGAGPAGLSAALYAARQKLKLLVISKNIGGQVLWSADVENYLGFENIVGTELSEKYLEHVKKYKIEIKEDETVTLVDKKGKIFAVKTDKADYEAKVVIITSGKEPRKLDVLGEKKFLGNGVSYCATCDGLFFQGEDVAVIGGGNAGADAALQLEKIAKKVYLIEISDKLMADQISIEQCRKSKKIEIMTKTKVKEIYGKDTVEGVKVEAEGKEKDIKLQGVFVEIGSIPSVNFVKGLKKNKFNEIIVNNKNETNIPGIFAAGDVTDIPEKQIIVAAGEGCKAALSAFKYLSKK